MRERNETSSRTHDSGRAATGADGDVQDTLDRLADALTSGDGRAAGSFWQAPAFVLGDEHELAVSKPEEFEQFFGGAREQYNQRGVTDTRAKIQRLDWLTDRIALATVRWPHLDAQDREVGTETSTYVLRRGDDRALKLRVAIMHGEEPGAPRKSA